MVSNETASMIATPDEIAASMTGVLSTRAGGGVEAYLPSQSAQNHAAFLHTLGDGRLVCAWFGGTLEGMSDISIHLATLAPDNTAWLPSTRILGAPDRSEQNPVLFQDVNGAVHLFHTSQPSGNQDESRVMTRPVTFIGDGVDYGPLRDTGLPSGAFVRAPLTVRDDGAWVLPLHLCNAQPRRRWTGAHDTAAVAVSTDRGARWNVTEVPNSTGSVHMTLVDMGNGRLTAFYRRRQADFVHRSESLNGGRSWSKPVPTDLPNNNSSISAIRLSDGRIALLCNPVSAAMSSERRQSLYDELGESDAQPDAAGGCVPIWGVPRAPLSLCVSSDGGHTFSQRRVVDAGPGTCLSNNSLDGRNAELSYPFLCQGTEGILHLAYTYHRRAIKYVRLDPDWLDS